MHRHGDFMEVRFRETHGATGILFQRLTDINPLANLTKRSI